MKRIHLLSVEARADAFLELIEQKGWDVPDIVIHRESLVLDPGGGV